MEGRSRPVTLFLHFWLLLAKCRDRVSDRKGVISHGLSVISRLLAVNLSHLEIEGKDKDNMSDEFLDKYPMLRRHFPILWYLLLLSREIDTRRGEGDQESEPGPSLQTVPS